jgi:hypothetical protein
LCEKFLWNSYFKTQLDSRPDRTPLNRRKNGSLLGERNRRFLAYPSYGAGRAANCGYADVVAVGQFVDRSALRAAARGLLING